MIATLYDKFKPWSAGGSVWIFSDPHFEDSDCKLMDLSWISPQKQIDYINKKVMPADTLIILGDIGNPEWVKKIKSRNKILIMGNHDVSRTKFEPYFNEIYEGPVFIAEKILLSHEPILNSNWLNIHGHDHSISDGIEVMRDPRDSAFEGLTKKPTVVGINLAANVIGYEPVNLKDIINKGYLNKINSIHRETINNASKKTTSTFEF